MPQFRLAGPGHQEPAGVHRQPASKERSPSAIARPGTARQEQIVDGRRDGQLSQLRRMPHHRAIAAATFGASIPEQINFAPPILNGEGAKVQPEWLFRFLQGADADPAMAEGADADLPLDNHEDDTLVDYFAATGRSQVPFVYLNTNTVSGGGSAKLARS